MTSPKVSVSVAQDRLLRFVGATLVACGSAPDQAEAVARVLVATSLRGVDSHSIRLLPYYFRAIGGGRIESTPVLSVERTAPGAAVVDALLSFGGARFGFKGAALAAMMEVLSAALTGMAHCSRLLPMWGPYMSTPRRMGQFFIVINPDAFVLRAVYEVWITAYLVDPRARPGKAGHPGHGAGRQGMGMPGRALGRRHSHRPYPAFRDHRHCGRLGSRQAFASTGLIQPGELGRMEQ